MKKPLVEWKQLTVRVPVEVHRALKVRAAEEGRSLAVIIEGLVRGYLTEGEWSLLAAVPVEGRTPKQVAARLRSVADAVEGHCFTDAQGSTHKEGDAIPVNVPGRQSFTEGAVTYTRSPVMGAMVLTWAIAKEGSKA